MVILVLYAQLGVSALISGMVILLVVPAQYWLAAKLGATLKLIMVSLVLLCCIPKLVNDSMKGHN